MAIREEIQAHLAALNEAWQRYDALEKRPRDAKTYGEEVALNQALNQANADFKSALEWLSEHGVPGQALTHDAPTLTFSLAPDTLPVASQ